MIRKLFSNTSGILRFKIFSAITLIIIGLLLSGTFILVTQRLGYNAVADTLAATARNTKLLLATVVNSEIALAKKMANSPVIQLYFENPQNDQFREHAFREIASYEKNFEDKSLFFINDVDRMFYRSNKEPYFVDASLPENYWYNMTLYETITYNFNINYNPDLNETNLWVNVPVFSDRHIPLGMVGTSIKIDDFIKQVLMVDNTIFLYMFNQFNEVTVAREQQLVLDKTLLPDHLGDIGTKILSLAENKDIEDAIFESIYIKIDLLYTSPQQGGEPWQSVKIAAQNMR